MRGAIKIPHSRFHLCVKKCLLGFVQTISVSMRKFKLFVRDPVSIIIEIKTQIFVAQQKGTFNSREVIAHTDKKAIS